MNLTQLALGKQANVIGVVAQSDDDGIASRLLDLGFVVGESVSCVALAPWGGDPMLVQIGFTRFALRRTEAERIQIEVPA